MTTRNSRPYSARRAAMLGAVLLAGTAWPALAASADPTTDPVVEAPAVTQDTDAQDDGEIIVTGYRGSLQSSTNAKRNSTGFTDTIFAEDIGKFPDTNIAESFNRVPGITISREITGEGLQITIRGLGTNFTRVLLNNAPVSISSTGRTDAQSTNREVDLDLFPTELFTQLTVNKSPTPGMIEGGAAGTVNMRTARPFDNPGTHLTYSGQLTNGSNAGSKWGYRGSILASYTSGDFGVLLGVAGVRNEVRVKGYETIGWTNPNLTVPPANATPAQILAAQCRTATGCNGTGGGNFTIPNAVPTNANIPGVAAGTAINQDFLLAQNPGATLAQIDNGIIPRLGRPSDEYGTKERLNFIASVEYKGDGIHAYIDGMFGRKKNLLERIDMNWVGRNGAAIPVNTQYDRTDCTAGCVVTKGTYYNAQWFLEYRPHNEHVQYWGINPGIDIELSDTLQFDLNANYTKSQFHRESPSVVVITPGNSGVTVNYDNTDGNIPTVTTNLDLNNPANFGWPGGRVNIQDERRTTYTKGVRGNLRWGDNHLNLRVGSAYDDVSRTIRGYDNSQAWQNAVCGNRPNVFLPGPNRQPNCNGLNAPGAAASGDPTYPAYGTGFTAGQAGPITYAGSLIPNGAPLAAVLKPGPSGFVTVDWEKFKAASQYDTFHNASPESGGANTGATGGYVRERTLGAYAEVNGDVNIGDNRLVFNAGVRWVRTQQTIGGRVSVPDPRNSTDPDGVGGPLPADCPGTGANANARDGSCYPNIVNFIYTDTDYTNWLPSASAAFHIGDNAVVRGSVSRTMTRPNPNSMLPGLNFSSPSADVGSVGNPALSPFMSDNIDLGFEYYTGAEGYIGFTAFRKAVTGFTVTTGISQDFSTLEAYGVTFNTLSPTQQTGICARAQKVPPNCTAADVAGQKIVLNQLVNATGTLKVNGLEVNWVQPLDFLLGRYLGLNGFGFNANLTLISQTGSGNAPAVATGVAPLTYNVTVYYERGGITLRGSTTFTQGGISATAPQNGITLAGLYNDDYQQFDLSAGFDLGEIFGSKGLPELTVDVQNVTKAQQRSYFQFENAAFTLYDPGRMIMIGLRGRF